MAIKDWFTRKPWLGGYLKSYSKLGRNSVIGRLKDGGRAAARYDRCPKVFLSAMAFAAIAMVWL
ncbi:hypothetical protein GL279_19125 [Paracoccus limosus]|uniref:Transposase n=1 Tax=Paracoccus limosus TaxID=913252 RepID=A0A844H9M1_9RHOB|nr:hypothetical protein [Paracoccus limosus]